MKVIMANPAPGREIDGRNEPGGEDQRIALAALLGPSVPSALAVGGVLIGAKARE